MKIDTFLNTLNETPDTVEFDDMMAVVEQNYHFTETTFSNGTLVNKSGENSGSCKLFYFAQMQGLDQQQTLACFGAYYRDDVLQNLKADNHQNIRHFMNSSWEGVVFSGDALSLRVS